MKRSILLISLLSVMVGVVFAQQTPQFTQYNQSRYIINPAATGENEYFTGVLGFRKQWVGLGEEPTTIFAGGHIGLRKTKPEEHQPLALRTSRPEAFHFEQSEGEVSKFKHGVGVHMISDNYGAFKKNTFGLNYALHIPLNDEVNISFGGSGSFNNIGFNQDKAVPTDINDAVYQGFIDDRNSLSMIDFNFGGYLYSSTYFLGYATNQLLGDNINFGNTASKLALHHSIIAGYHYQMNDDMLITPSIYFKAVGGAPLSYDFNLRVDYTNFFGAVTYRNQDAIAILLGLYFNDNLSLGYSYDLNTSQLKGYNSGGHEIVLGIGLSKNKELEQKEEIAE